MSDATDGLITVDPDADLSDAVVVQQRTADATDNIYADDSGVVRTDGKAFSSGAFTLLWGDDR